jgi:hypothetical protein
MKEDLRYQPQLCTEGDRPGDRAIFDVVMDIMHEVAKPLPIFLNYGYFPLKLSIIPFLLASTRHLLMLRAEIGRFGG